MWTKYAAWLSYAGTRYCGWQRQNHEGAPPSIQQTIEAILHRITLESVTVVGSGRTDSGVHALGQVAHFKLEKKEWSPAILQNALNALLPEDIRVLGVQRMSSEFHAQKSAIKKQYSYYFQQGPCDLPPLRPYTWWIRRRLDLGVLREAAASLVGRHDFRAFRASGAKPGSTVREILEAEVVFQPFPFPGGPGWENPLSDPRGWVRLRLVGTGFLKQMVRGIAGTLLQVGEGRRSPDCIRQILASGDRAAIGPTAPARGLWLERVWYGKEVDKPSVHRIEPFSLKENHAQEIE